MERKRVGKKKKSEKKEIAWKKEAGLELMVLVTFIELDIIPCLSFMFILCQHRN